MPKRLITALLLATSCGTLQADIYRWQDAQGRWHFSDQKPDNPNTTVKQLPKAAALTQNTSAVAAIPGEPQDIKAQLEAAFQPQTPIEASTLAVVGIETALGQGSGFFVHADGFIVTNKHVIRPTTTPKWEKRMADAEEAQSQLNAQAEKLNQEKRRLQNYQKDLKTYKAELDRYSYNKTAYQLRSQEYKRHLEQYQSQLNQYQQALSRHQTQQRQFDQVFGEFRFNSSVAGVARHFQVTLKDGSQHTAEVVSISQDHDLALLRLSNVIAPTLTLGRSSSARQGHRVFAIGSPLGMQDSLTAGIIARLEPRYLITDAQILPGNSGGPLLNKEAQVVGVNTLKLAREVMSDGFGAAIPVETVKQEFKRYLP